MAPPFLTLWLDGGEWSASLPGRFIPGECAPRTYCIGGCEGPQIRPRCCGIQNNLLSWPGTESRAVQPLPCRYTDWVISAPSSHGINSLWYLHGTFTGNKINRKMSTDRMQYICFHKALSFQCLIFETVKCKTAVQTRRWVEDGA
jgi:hypothetical protein